VGWMGTEHRAAPVAFELFLVWVVKYWHRLLREAVEAPSLETFKARLDGALSNLI